MKDLEDNPVTQIRFHKRMMRIWIWNAPFVMAIYSLSFVFPAYAIQVAAFLGTYTAMISLYANWVSDFDGLSAAQSTLETIKQNQTAELKSENYPPKPTIQAQLPTTLHDLINGSNNASN